MYFVAVGYITKINNDNFIFKIKNYNKLKTWKVFNKNIKIDNNKINKKTFIEGFIKDDNYILKEINYLN